MTESCAATFVQYPHKMSHVGSVGPPMPGIELRLEEVTELGHSPSGKPPRGEVCIRGPAMFKGYYKQPELTAEVWCDVMYSIAYIIPCFTVYLSSWCGTVSRLLRWGKKSSNTTA